ncbi:MAG: hypothetical protein CSB33_03035 [Desulfobacterales bacterium]|nr:MAG: hypothetical protein CSB33_03035 [Desulfobacterales bacterium]
MSNDASPRENPRLEATPEQVLYARLLEKGMYAGLLLLVITFGIYCFGIMKPYIPLNDLSQYWSLSVDEYLAHANVHPGWAWLGMVGYGDFLNFIPIAILAGVTIICYLAIAPGLFRSGDKVYGVLALLEALVLSVAASGILGGGGH